MARFLLCALGSPGFVGPHIGVGTALREAGHEATILSASVVRALVPHADQRAPAFSTGRGFNVANWGDQANLKDQFTATLRAIKTLTPSAVMVDQFAMGALIAANLMRLPVAVMGLGSYLLPSVGIPLSDQAPTRFPTLMAAYNNLAASVGLVRSRTDAFDDACPLVGDRFFLRSIPGFEFKHPLPAQTVFIGDAIYPFPAAIDHELELYLDIVKASDRPLVILQVQKQFDAFDVVPEIIQACAASGCHLVCAVGQLAKRYNTSPQVLVRSSADLNRLLPLSQGMVSSGHATPVLSALKHGKPNVIINYGSGAEEMLERCERAGVGFGFSTLPVQKQVERALDRLFADHTFSANAERLATRLAATDGFEIARLTLEELVNLTPLHRPLRARVPTQSGRPRLAQLAHDPTLEPVDVAHAHVDSPEWSVSRPSDHDEIFVRVLHREQTIRGQGWKIHVSADPLNCLEVMTRCLPVLLKARTSFKVVASRSALQFLNEGRGGLSQAGKFLTVYPNSDAEFCNLCTALSAATEGFVGPIVLSDRAVSDHGIVHYRYGSFGNLFIQTSIGEVVPAMYTNEHVLVPDPRLLEYRRPHWIADPFGDDSPRVRTVGNYHLVTSLQRAARGSVYLGVDLTNLRRCVVKQARRGQLRDAEGRDAFARLEHEERILIKLRESVHVPRILDRVEHERELFIVMEDVDGLTLEATLQGRFAAGRLPSTSEIVHLASPIAHAIHELHNRNVLFRDLKPSNILVRSSGEYCLVDFETAFDRDSVEPPVGRGTRGYMRPIWNQGEPPTASDDVYSFGALLYWLATGADPSLACDSADLLKRPLHVMNPGLSDDCISLVQRCLGNGEALNSMAEVIVALEQLERCQDRLPVSPRSQTQPAAMADRLARDLSETLCRDAIRVGNGVAWRDHRFQAPLFANRDLGNGLAGHILCLSEVVRAGIWDDGAEVLRRAITTLRESRPLPGGPLPGLFVGEMGVAVALLAAAEALGDRELVRSADEHVRHSLAIEHPSPDMFNGMAGRIKGHLIFWRATRAEWHLGVVQAYVNQLLDSQLVDEMGGRWPMGEGLGPLSGRTYAGYAHGAAGIGDSLADFYRITRCSRTRQALVRTAEWLERLATPTLDDSNGTDWPTTVGGGMGAGRWCHGAAGVGTFFLNLSEFSIFPGAKELAVSAARYVARGARWLGPCRCHGLAGSIEMMLDFFRSTHDERYLAEANELADILVAFRVTREDKVYIMGDEVDAISPAFLTGYGGVLTSLIRLIKQRPWPGVLEVRAQDEFILTHP